MLFKGKFGFFFHIPFEIVFNAIIEKYGIGGIDLPQRTSWSPLHHAVVEGHEKVVEVLLKLGANVEKPLGTNFDRMTPLMLAAARSNLSLVKILVSKYNAKIEKPDKYKRTAMTHAAMNGATNVMSYLLFMGASYNKPDSSGNSNLHYACAYGWYFCAKLLLDCGAQIDARNDWKLTPLAISLLKGHTGRILDNINSIPSFFLNICQ